MEDFYFYTIVIALIILIIMLTMIGIILSYGNETKVYPPVQNEGPDYWVRAASGTTDFDVGANNSPFFLPTGTDPTNFFKVPTGSTDTNKGNSVFQTSQTITDWVLATDNVAAIGAAETAGYVPAKLKSPAKIYGITGVRTGGSSPYTYYIQLIGNDAEWTAAYPGLTVRCAKQKWALDNGIVWDGVTNYNGCTVDPNEVKKTTATIPKK
jgi:hypothetical protein